MASSIAIATLSSNATANNLEATSSEIDGALNQIVLTNVENFSCDDFEDAIQNKLYQYFNSHDYAPDTTFEELKNFLGYGEYTFIMPYSINNNRHDLMFIMNDRGGSSNDINNEDTSFQPIYFEASNASLTYLNEVNDHAFIGINVSKDLAIGIYNFMAEIINNFFDVLEIISIAKATTLSTLVSFIENLALKISSSIVSYINAIPSGFFGSLIKILLTVVVIGAALILAACFGFGMFEKGFYIGFIRYGFMNWNFVMGVYE